jgi:hypothetical protein
MVRLIFLTALLVYIWFQSLFVQTSHTVVGETHIFGYNRIGLVLGLGFNIVPIGMAWFLWRVKKDKTGAAIFLLAIPLFAVAVLPQLLMERVKLTPTQLIHRREPPHTRYNADINLDDITSAVELVYQSGRKGYIFQLKDGRVLELPANTVMTSARDSIAAELLHRKIPATIRRVSR